MAEFHSNLLWRTAVAKDTTRPAHPRFLSVFGSQSNFHTRSHSVRITGQNKQNERDTLNIIFFPNYQYNVGRSFAMGMFFANDIKIHIKCCGHKSVTPVRLCSCRKSTQVPHLFPYTIRIVLKFELKPSNGTEANRGNMFNKRRPRYLVRAAAARHLRQMRIQPRCHHRSIRRLTVKHRIPATVESQREIKLYYSLREARISPSPTEGNSNNP